MARRHLGAMIAGRLLFVGRFTFLLVAQILLLVIFPLVEGKEHALVSLRFLYSLLLVAALVATSGRRWTLAVVVCLFVPAATTHWVNLVLGSRWLAFVDGCLAVAILGFTVIAILRWVLRARHVSGETIGGALCAYLLLGMIWAFLFGLMELAHPGSFRLADPLPPHDFHFVFQARGFGQFVYFSFCTLTTVGYGDIIPLTPAARTFAYLEAVAGQIYLAVLIAHLVGLHVAQAGREARSGEQPNGTA
jgi:hypothetical protein